MSVPFATTGGMLGLLARGMPFSLPAAVGFIALGGVSVLNGVVIATATRRVMLEGKAIEDAAATGTTQSIRAVLTTAAVAGLGFLPMALSTSAGSEVQRPLATVVIVGIFFSTALTLVVFPGILAMFLRGWTEGTEEAEDPAEHFIIQKIGKLSQAEFLAHVRSRLGRSSRYKDHAVVFAL